MKYMDWIGNKEAMNFMILVMYIAWAGAPQHVTGIILKLESDYGESIHMKSSML